MIDQTKIGIVAAQFMEGIQQDYPDDAEIEEVIILTSVRYNTGKDSAVVMRASDRIPRHEAIGMLVLAQQQFMSLPGGAG